MKVRPAISGLTIDEAMARVVEIADGAALLRYLEEHYAFWKPTRETVKIEPYGFDDRIGWDTHLITVDGKAALFSDGPLDLSKDVPPPDPVTRAFESLAALPALEGGFLRHLFFQAINDPDLAANAALAEHLYLVPQVLRALALEPDVIRQIHTRPGMEEWARNALSAIAVVGATGHPRVSADTLAKLSHIALRDPAFLANFLEGRPASPFLDESAES